MKKRVLADLAVPGTEIEIRVTPNWEKNDLLVECMGLRVFVQEDIESDDANGSAAEVLSEALGVHPAQIHLISGAHSRDKVFVVDA